MQPTQISTVEISYKSFLFLYSELSHLLTLIFLPIILLNHFFVCLLVNFYQFHSLPFRSFCPLLTFLILVPFLLLFLRVSTTHLLNFTSSTFKKHSSHYPFVSCTQHSDICSAGQAISSFRLHPKVRSHVRPHPEPDNSDHTLPYVCDPV